MSPLEITIGVLLLVMSLFLVVAVLLQSGKDKKLSGTIAGNSDTFYGKNKGKRWDKVLSTATTVVSVIFTLLVIVMYVIV